MNPAPPFVVEALRGDVTESTHLVDAAVVDPDGRLFLWAGDPAIVAFLRSVAKPVQATVCLELGWSPPADPQLAVACASHNGEPPHVDAVRATLAAVGLDEDALQCPAEARGRIYHNCSGKHAAMLATTITNGWDPKGYLDAGNQLQRAVRARVEKIAGVPSRAVATDGCGVPTFAFTLTQAAAMFARLPVEAGRALAAMRSYPYLVAGSQRICTTVMTTTSGVVLKVGAEGVICGVLDGPPIGFALKSRDGSARGREIAAVHLLEMLGALTETASDSVVGEILPRLAAGPGRHPTLRFRGTLERA